MTRRAMTVLLWGGIAVLCAVGIASAIQRGIALAGDHAAFERQTVEDIATLYRLEPDSPERARLERVIPASSANLVEHPRATFAHMIPGALLLLLAPLQFSRRLRTRHPAVHRWTGRFLLSLVAIAGASGIYLGLAMPYGGAIESGAASLFGAFLLLAATRGFIAIRRRDIRRHREWMIRMFTLAVAISVIRLLGVLGVFAFGTETINARGFGLMLWVGWLVSILTAELWILRTRARPAVESVHGLQPL
jgi:uncharacterized membrane protein